ncbi:hypothetical protein BDN70DRAFT_588702 [Pholiota conissans]|uniref:Uncharacterized protein n=1 Tax=Pholiota conissans TaxID=109636 RepID=A0A9P5ZEE6_9AGAR|nr:hypothetical protein BDN70DRAFT_588702 [Pholiota conissans]
MYNYKAIGRLSYAGRDDHRACLTLCLSLSRPHPPLRIIHQNKMSEPPAEIIDDRVDYTDSCFSEKDGFYKLSERPSWESVENANRLSLWTLIEAPDVTSQLYDFLDHLKYPLCIRDSKFIALASMIEDKVDQSISFSKYNSYECSVNLYSCKGLFEQDGSDPYEIEQWMPVLLVQWHSILILSRTEYANAAELLHGVQGMIQLAFEQRRLAKHHCRAQEVLCLPTYPWTTTGDVIAYISISSRDWRCSLGHRRNAWVFSTDEESNFDVVTFVCEADTKIRGMRPPSRKLALSLCSAQNQRRALGFPDGPVYGAALVGDVLTIFVAGWRYNTYIKAERVVVHRTSLEFILTSFRDFIQCYFFLCKLSDDAAQVVDDIHAKWETEEGKKELEEKNRAASRNPWRIMQHPPRPRRALVDEPYETGRCDSPIGEFL